MEKINRQNRIREALGNLYDQHPPYFREYLRRFKDDPTSRVFAPLAEAYRRLGRLDDAVEICLFGLEHHPDFHAGRVTLAKCYIDRRKFPEARHELERVVQFSPENLLAQRLLGDVHCVLADKPRALHAYKMALLLSPNDVALSEKVHLLEQGKVPAGLTDSDLGGTDHSVVADFKAEAPLRIEPEAKSESPLPAISVSSAERFDFARDDSASPTGDDCATPAPALPSAPAPSLESLFGTDDDADEAFKTQHVSQVFAVGKRHAGPEITSETLGDLYFSQGQFDRAIRIFERLAEKGENADLVRKTNLCRLKLGVDKSAVLRGRQIDLLKSLLSGIRSTKHVLDQ